KSLLLLLGAGAVLAAMMMGQAPGMYQLASFDVLGWLLIGGMLAKVLFAAGKSEAEGGGEADEFKSLREALDLHKETLASKLGVSGPSIVRWEKGRPLPPEKLQALRVIYKESAPRIFKSLREVLGLSQEEAGKKKGLSVTHTTIYAWETGKALLPPEKLQALRVIYKESAPRIFKSLRMALNLSRKDMAHRLGTKEHIVLNWELGLTLLPQKELEKIKAIYKELAPQIFKSTRDLLALAQEDVATRLGVSQRTIANWENHTFPLPPEKLQALRAIYKELAPQIFRSLREALGLRGGQLADMLDVTNATISRWENHTDPLPAEKLQALRVIYKESAPRIFKSLRQLLGLTREDVGHRLGVTSMAILLWENYTHSLPLEKLQALRAIYNDYSPFRLKALIEESGLDMRALQQALGLSYSSLYLKRKGQVRIYSSTLEKILSIIYERTVGLGSVAFDQGRLTPTTNVDLEAMDKATMAYEIRQAFAAIIPDKDKRDLFSVLMLKIFSSREKDSRRMAMRFCAKHDLTFTEFEEFRERLAGELSGVKTHISRRPKSAMPAILIAGAISLWQCLILLPFVVLNDAILGLINNRKYYQATLNKHPVLDKVLTFIENRGLVSIQYLPPDISKHLPRLAIKFIDYVSNIAEPFQQAFRPSLVPAYAGAGSLAVAVTPVPLTPYGMKMDEGGEERRPLGYWTKETLAEALLNPPSDVRDAANSTHWNKSKRHKAVPSTAVRLFGSWEDATQKILGRVVHAGKPAREKAWVGEYSGPKAWKEVRGVLPDFVRPGGGLVDDPDPKRILSRNLNADEIRALRILIDKGNAPARLALIMTHTGLVASIAKTIEKTFDYLNLDKENLINIGMWGYLTKGGEISSGLARAAELYKPQHKGKAKFSTYARGYITQAIMRFVREEINKREKPLDDSSGEKEGKKPISARIAIGDLRKEISTIKRDDLKRMLCDLINAGEGTKAERNVEFLLMESVDGFTKIEIGEMYGIGRAGVSIAIITTKREIKEALKKLGIKKGLIGDDTFAELDILLTRRVRERGYIFDSGDDERRIIVEALDKHGWNQSAAARELGEDRSNLNKKLQKLGIDARRAKQDPQYAEQVLTGAGVTEVSEEGEEGPQGPVVTNIPKSFLLLLGAGAVLAAMMMGQAPDMYQLASVGDVLGIGLLIGVARAMLSPHTDKGGTSPQVYDGSMEEVIKCIRLSIEGQENIPDLPDSLYRKTKSSTVIRLGPHEISSKRLIGYESFILRFETDNQYYGFIVNIHPIDIEKPGDVDFRLPLFSVYLDIDTNLFQIIDRTNNPSVAKRTSFDAFTATITPRGSFTEPKPFYLKCNFEGKLEVRWGLHDKSWSGYGKLLKLTLNSDRFKKGKFYLMDMKYNVALGWTIEAYELENFEKVTWYPHATHRLVAKSIDSDEVRAAVSKEWVQDVLGEVVLDLLGPHIDFSKIEEEGFVFGTESINLGHKMLQSLLERGMATMPGVVINPWVELVETQSGLITIGSFEIKGKTKLVRMETRISYGSLLRVEPIKLKKMKGWILFGFEVEKRDDLSLRGRTPTDVWFVNAKKGGIVRRFSFDEEEKRQLLDKVIERSEKQSDRQKREKEKSLRKIERGRKKILELTGKKPMRKKRVLPNKKPSATKKKDAGQGKTPGTSIASAIQTRKERKQANRQKRAHAKLEDNREKLEVCIVKIEHLIDEILKKDTILKMRPLYRKLDGALVELACIDHAGVLVYLTDLSKKIKNGNGGSLIANCIYELIEATIEDIETGENLGEKNDKKERSSADEDDTDEGEEDEEFDGLEPEDIPELALVEDYVEEGGIPSQPESDQRPLGMNFGTNSKDEEGEDKGSIISPDDVVVKKLPPDKDPHKPGTPILTKALLGKKMDLARAMLSKDADGGRGVSKARKSSQKPRGYYTVEKIKELMHNPPSDVKDPANSEHWRNSKEYKWLPIAARRLYGSWPKAALEILGRAIGSGQLKKKKWVEKYSGPTAWEEVRAVLPSFVKPRGGLVDDPDPRDILNRDLNTGEIRALRKLIDNGNGPARSTLIMTHKGLVSKIAKKIRRYYAYMGFDLRKLIPIGMWGNMNKSGEIRGGLARAAELYKYKVGAKFSSYAGEWIYRTIMEFVLIEIDEIRVPLREDFGKEKDGEKPIGVTIPGGDLRKEISSVDRDDLKRMLYDLVGAEEGSKDERGIGFLLMHAVDGLTPQKIARVCSYGSALVSRSITETMGKIREALIELGSEEGLTVDTIEMIDILLTKRAKERSSISVNNNIPKSLLLLLGAGAVLAAMMMGQTPGMHQLASVGGALGILLLAGMIYQVATGAWGEEGLSSEEFDGTINIHDYEPESVSTRVDNPVTLEETKYAIAGFYTRDNFRSLKTIVQDVFEKEVPISNVARIEVQKVQQGDFSRIFKAEIHLKSGEVGATSLNLPISHDRPSEAVEQEYNLLMYFNEKHPSYVVRPITYSEERISDAPDGLTVPIFALEWLGDYVEFNQEYSDDTGEEYFALNYYGRDGEFEEERQLGRDGETHSRVLSKIVEHIVEMAEYDASSGSVVFIDYIALSAGDFMFRWKDDNEFELRLITIRNVRSGTSVDEFLDYLLKNEAFSFMSYYAPLMNSHQKHYSPQPIIFGILQGLVRKYGQNDGVALFGSWMDSYSMLLNRRIGLLSDGLMRAELGIGGSDDQLVEWLGNIFARPVFSHSRLIGHERRALESYKSTGRVAPLLQNAMHSELAIAQEVIECIDSVLSSDLRNVIGEDEGSVVSADEVDSDGSAAKPELGLDASTEVSPDSASEHDEAGAVSRSDAEPSPNIRPARAVMLNDDAPMLVYLGTE
ncbi:MAG: helix-turn-helix domain-containing protein, partial [Candidatus Omnitrophica bacterium]|nr:helix-turn-helix domain-containing protein [Candidatus Omnitrophota bacterium]